LLALGACAVSSAQQANMSFFVTSVGSGKGADLGAWRGLIGCANSWRKPPEPRTAPGVAISTPKRSAVSRRSTRAIASERVRGRAAKGAVVAKDVNQADLSITGGDGPFYCFTAN
jgi:hypothetical protein